MEGKLWKPKFVKLTESRLLALWVVLNLAVPCTIWENLQHLKWYKLDVSYATISLAVFNSISLCFFEAMLLLLLLGAVKTTWAENFLTRTLAVVLKLVIVLSAFIYLVFLLISFTVCYFRGSYIGADDASMLLLLLDWSSWKFWVTSKDKLLFCSILFVAALFLVIFFAQAKSWSKRSNLKLSLFCLVFLVVANILVSRSAKLFLPKGKLHDLRFFVSQFMGPQLSLFSPILYSRTSSYQKTELSLEPYRTLEDYLSSVPKDFKPTRSVLVFVIEAMRYDVLETAGGDPRIVPTINALARKGVSFQRAYAPSAETIYSFNGLLTGLFPLKYDVRDLNQDVSYPHLLLYDLLADLGYHTAYLTTELPSSKRLSRSDKLELYNDPQFSSNPSSENRDRPTAYGDELHLDQFDKANAKLLVEWIRKHEHSDRPFFAIVYFTSSHFPYTPPLGFRGPFETADLEVTPSFMAYPVEIAPLLKSRYWNTLNFVDSLIEQINVELQCSPHSRNLITVVTGDHGQAFGEHGRVAHGGSLYDPLLRVPLVVSGISDLELTGDIGEPVSLIDLAPTILEILGLPAYGGFQGSSIVTVRKHGKQLSPGHVRPIFASIQGMIFEDALIAYPYKYIKSVRKDYEMLFDLRLDPGETHNIAETRKELTDYFAKILQGFRNSQLTYYSLPTEERKRYFPPKPLQAVAISPESRQN